MYEAMYYHLFNAITDALELLDESNFLEARRILERAQQETEEQYIEESK